jgi:hypothetical protein
VGTELVDVYVPPQTVPSTMEQFDAPEGGWPHVP